MFSPGPDPGTAIQAIAAQNRVAGARADLVNASSAMDAAFAAEARANADAALRVRTLVVELSAMTVAASFPSPHAVDPTNKMAAANPVPGSNPAWFTGAAQEPPLGGHQVDVAEVAVGHLSGAYDDVAVVLAVGAVIGEVGFGDDPDTPGWKLEPAFDFRDAWGTSMERTDGWKQKIADHFGVDLEDEDVTLGEDLYTVESLALGVKGAAKGVEVEVAKLAALKGERALRKLDSVKRAGDQVVAAARGQNEQRIAAAAPNGEAAVDAAEKQAVVDLVVADREARRLLAERPGPRRDPFSGEYFDPRRGLTPEEYDDRYGDFYHRVWPKQEGFRLAISEPNTVQVGAVLDRFGESSGSYLAPAGTPWEERALAVQSLDDTLHRYRVVRELPTYVREGPAASAFGQPGGGRQYYVEGRELNVQSLIDDGYLEEIP